MEAIQTILNYQAALIFAAVILLTICCILLLGIFVQVVRMNSLLTGAVIWVSEEEDDPDPGITNSRWGQPVKLRLVSDRCA
jgi:hypothetical protein